MTTSPSRSIGKRKNRRRATKVNRRLQLRAGKSWTVNVCAAVPVYGSVTLHLPPLPQGPAALLAALASSALATWLNSRTGHGHH